MVANAIIAAFAMTWTSWRTSSAASDMFAKPASQSTSRPQRERGPAAKAQFSGVVVVNADGESPAQQDSATHEMENEPWQFYCMMCLAGLYMAMVLTDWDSTDGYVFVLLYYNTIENVESSYQLIYTVLYMLPRSSSNGVSMWVKIVAQWLTILLFSWTLVAPKLFPDRDFS